MEHILSLILAVVVVAPSGVELERLTDSTILPPGVSGHYFITRLPPRVCDGSVYFAASYLSKAGLYRVSSSSLDTVVNFDTPVPGTAETFEAAERPACAGGRVMFLGRKTNAPLGAGRSVYEVSQSGLSLFLEEGVVIDGREVQSFSNVALSPAAIGLIAALIPASIAQGVIIKPFDAPPFLVADETTVLPGQTVDVTIYSQPIWHRDGLVFRARTRQQLGLYRWTENAGLSVLVDTNTPVPGGGAFFSFGGVASLHDGIVFEATFSGGFGLFVWSNGSIQPLLIPGDALDDGDVLTYAALPVGAGRLLGFSGRSVQHPTTAIWVRKPDGSVRRILGLSDTIEGRTVDLVISDADHADIAIYVDSGDDPRTQIIYRATFADPAADIPLAPAGLALLALGLALAGLHLLRH